MCASLDLPSAVLELAHLYAAYAHDVSTGERTAPDFNDATRMHDLIEAAERSMRDGVHINLPAPRAF